MDKQALLQNIIAQLEAELTKARAAARATQDAATDEQNRPENQYDTRALEASFLARGQNARVAELEHSIHVLRSFPLRSFKKDEAVQTGCLVVLDCEGKEVPHFLLPAGAGLHTQNGANKIQVVTTSSPLGTELLGKFAGDSFVFRRGGGTKEYEILSIE